MRGRSYRLVSHNSILNLNINEANKIFRRSIIGGFFEPRLLGMNFKKSTVRHPLIDGDGLLRSDLLHMFFDVETGSDYPDGDEWFIVDMLCPRDENLPDLLSGADHFVPLYTMDGKRHGWHHRQLIRYKCGKSKKLIDSLGFLESKYVELHRLLESSL